MNFERPWVYTFFAATRAYERGFDTTSANDITIYDYRLDIPLWNRTTLSVGKQKEPISMERIIGLVYQPFGERTSVSDSMLPSRNVGVVVNSTLPGERLSYAVGVFNDWFDAGERLDEELDAVRRPGHRLAVRLRRGGQPAPRRLWDALHECQGGCALPNQTRVQQRARFCRHRVRHGGGHRIVERRPLHCLRHRAVRAPGTGLAGERVCQNQRDRPRARQSDLLGVPRRRLVDRHRRNAKLQQTERGLQPATDNEADPPGGLGRVGGSPRAGRTST